MEMIREQNMKETIKKWKAATFNPGKRKGKKINNKQN